MGYATTWQEPAHVNTVWGNSRVLFLICYWKELVSELWLGPNTLSRNLQDAIKCLSDEYLTASEIHTETQSHGPFPSSFPSLSRGVLNQSDPETTVYNRRATRGLEKSTVIGLLNHRKCIAKKSNLLKLQISLWASKNESLIHLFFFLKICSQL